MKAILKSLLLIFVCTVSSATFGGELADADALFDKGQYKKALAIYLKHGKDPVVQNRIGNLYLTNELLNEKKSTEWFQKSADQGYADGIFNLAMNYREGIGVPKDYQKAFALFKQAAAKNSPDAMNSLGVMYKNGWGVKADEKEAANWYLKAAHAGSALGMCNVAGVFMYSKVIKQNYKKGREALDTCLESEPENTCCLDRMAELYGGGYGVPTDYKKAHELREKSAANGSAMAMYNLGRDFDYGIGVDKDPKAAMEWYQKAAKKDHAKAMYRLYEVYEYGKLGQDVDKTKAAEWKARAEKAMKEQGLSHNEWADDFRLKMEEANKDQPS